MRQTVQVTRLLEPGIAEVFLERQSACSGDCHRCGGCGAAREKLFVRAENQIGAKPGDRVTIESDTGPVLLSVFLVYGLPLVLFFLGYGIGAALALAPGLLGGLGFALGFVPGLLRNRRLMREKQPAFRIVGFAEE